MNHKKLERLIREKIKQHISEADVDNPIQNAISSVEAIEVNLLFSEDVKLAAADLKQKLMAQLQAATAE